MIPVNIINKIINNFYALAIKDIMIGYHFRHIEDFDTHIPRITQFWNLQLNGIIENKALLPFSFLEVHRPLRVNRGEIYRWVKIFSDVLKKSESENELTTQQVHLWEEKVKLFSLKLEKYLFGPNSI